MEADAARRLRLVKKETAHGFLDIGAHGVPSVALREDIFRQAFGAIAAVLFLRHFKHQFFHGVKLRRKFSDRKRGLVAKPAAIFRNGAASSFSMKQMSVDISQTLPVRHPTRLAAITLALPLAKAGPPSGQANLLLEKADSPWSTATLPSAKADSPL
jgi:hypothetical protein